ncbi:uncharacterized protein DUF2325 [Acidovorax sp. 56]|uniref:DUF2325 domain-containing protein n=1 Tax=Acidovorax sp. 56 TaxID=2035205 RepID=UPI000C170638|nr:DUF2325 domain-containing protein [Acidovorax sp. 56]PIF26503.1 uncharacterized protein DUF2325 [Acidovorax sp. 56]
MHSLSQEFLALCRQLGEAQTRCSAAMAAQAAELERLQRDVVRLRAAVIVRDTRLEQARAALEEARQAQPPGLPRRKEIARHIRTLAERVAMLSRECLRWRLQAVVGAGGEKGAGLLADAPVASPTAAATLAGRPQASHSAAPAQPDLDESLAAADLVICQTGCISHDEYWRVQDHCRRTGKPCILVDQASPAPGVHVLQQPVVVLRMAQGLRAVRGVPGWGPPGDLPVGEHAALQTPLDSKATSAEVLERVHK